MTYFTWMLITLILELIVIKNFISYIWKRLFIFLCISVACTCRSLIILTIRSTSRRQILIHTSSDPLSQIINGWIMQRLCLWFIVWKFSDTLMNNHCRVWRFIPIKWLIRFSASYIEAPVTTIIYYTSYHQSWQINELTFIVLAINVSSHVWILVLVINIRLLLMSIL